MGAVFNGCAFSLQAHLCSPTFFQNAYAVRFSRTARVKSPTPPIKPQGLGFSKGPAITKAQVSTRSGTGGHPQSDRLPFSRRASSRPRKHSFPRQSTPASAPRPDGDRHRACRFLVAEAHPLRESPFLSPGRAPVAFWRTPGGCPADDTLRGVLGAKTPLFGLLHICSVVGTGLLSSGYRAGTRRRAGGKVNAPPVRTQPATFLTVATPRQTLRLPLRLACGSVLDPKATPEPPSSQLVGRGLRPSSHPHAIYMRPSSHPQATLKPPRGYPKATPRLPQHLGTEIACFPRALVVMRVAGEKRA